MQRPQCIKAQGSCVLEGIDGLGELSSRVGLRLDPPGLLRALAPLAGSARRAPVRLTASVRGLLLPAPVATLLPTSLDKAPSAKHTNNPPLSAVPLSALFGRSHSFQFCNHSLVRKTLKFVSELLMNSCRDIMKNRTSATMMFEKSDRWVNGPAGGVILGYFRYRVKLKKSTALTCPIETACTDKFT